MGGGVPEDEANSPLVLDKVDHGLGDGSGEAALGNLPDFDGAVLGRRSDHVVVVRAPETKENVVPLLNQNNRVNVSETT